LPLHFCQMLQYADWSQHVTHRYPTVRCCNMQTGNNTSHSGTQLSDVAVCRLVTTRHTPVPTVRCCNTQTGHNTPHTGTNCQMLQYADWSQHATHRYPTVRCCNMQTGHNMPRTGTQPSDVAICRLVTTRHTPVPNCQMLQ